MQRSGAAEGSRSRGAVWCVCFRGEVGRRTSWELNDEAAGGGGAVLEDGLRAVEVAGLRDGGESDTSGGEAARAESGPRAAGGAHRGGMVHEGSGGEEGRAEFLGILMRMRGFEVSVRSDNGWRKLRPPLAMVAKSPELAPRRRPDGRTDRPACSSQRSFSGTLSFLCTAAREARLWTYPRPRGAKGALALARRPRRSAGAIAGIQSPSSQHERRSSESFGAAGAFDGASPASIDASAPMLCDSIVDEERQAFRSIPFP